MQVMLAFLFHLARKNSHYLAKNPYFSSVIPILVKMLVSVRVAEMTR